MAAQLQAGTAQADTPQAPVAERLRCRQIGDTDLDELARLLAQGFPATSNAYWTTGFARWRAMPVVDGVPRFGYALESGQRLVGALLMLSSRRDDTIIINVSSWYVERAFRGHSALLVQMAAKVKHATYLNASPAPHTWNTLRAQGFQQFIFGRSAVFPLPGRGHVHETITGLPETPLLADHRAFGLTCVTVERDGIISPFVFRPRHLDRPAIGRLRPRMMDLLFCRGLDDFTRCAPALARHFLPRGVAGFLVDGKPAGLIHHYVEGKEPRFYKGPRPPVAGDLAYTEKVVFG